MVRILIVDDYEPWRRFLTSTLQKQPGLVIVGELSDGLAAVEKSQELRPDLIVLDVGLPVMNGLEAATRIRKHSPNAKILFLSQDSSPDTAEQALRTGASGYVVKAHAASDLLPAVTAALQGRRFVRPRFAASAKTPDTGSFRVD